MLTQADIDAIAARVARANLPANALISTSSRLYEDYYGGDALMVTVLIKDDLFPEVTGQQINQIIGDLQQELIKQGEKRFAYVEWKTDAPLSYPDAIAVEEVEGG